MRNLLSILPEKPSSDSRCPGDLGREFAPSGKAAEKQSTFDCPACRSDLISDWRFVGAKNWTLLVVCGQCHKLYEWKQKYSTRNSIKDEIERAIHAVLR